MDHIKGSQNQIDWKHFLKSDDRIFSRFQRVGSECTDESVDWWTGLGTKWHWSRPHSHFWLKPLGSEAVSGYLYPQCAVSRTGDQGSGPWRICRLHPLFFIRNPLPVPRQDPSDWCGFDFGQSSGSPGLLFAGGIGRCRAGGCSKRPLCNRSDQWADAFYHGG